jgi:hypothetical protein
LSEELLPWKRDASRDNSAHIKGKISTDRGEGLGVFGQAFLLELLLRELAPRLVAVLAVDRAEPALIFPTRRAEIDASLGQSSQFGPEPGRLGRGVVREE